MSAGRRFILVTVLGLVGAFLSGLLLLHHYGADEGIAFVNVMCGDPATSGCTTVNRSEYSTLLGFPLAGLGIIFYLSVSLLVGLSAFGNPEIGECAGWVMFYAVGVALFADLVLLIIQALAIKVLCSMCLSTYVITILLLLILLPYRRRGNLGMVREIFTQSEGKIVIAGWLVGTMLIVGVAVAANRALAYQDPRALETRLENAAYEEYTRSSLHEIDLAGVPYRGWSGAPLKIVIYSDFICPWCRQTAQMLEHYIPLWDSTVVVYFKNYPLDALCNSYLTKSVHPGACWAALAGLCAQEQGIFWRYHDQVYDKPVRSLTGTEIVKLAVEAGVDTLLMGRCMASQPLRQQLLTQIEEARKNGVTGTPAIFLNGKTIPKLVALRSILTKEAKRLGLPPLAGMKEE